MRKITVLSMISLDGVMQGPGGPEEDTSGGFTLGGWTAPYGDEKTDEVVKKELSQPVDYLLGRKTFEIWENYWPLHGDFWPGINSGMKYILSGTRKSSDWNKSSFIENVHEIQQLKNSEGADIQVWGSSKLVQLLFENDLVDELRLKVYPVLLGRGKKLFENTALPASFKVTETITTPKGVVISGYVRSGDVQTGSVSAK